MSDESSSYRDAIGRAGHDIGMMVQVLFNAIETMQKLHPAPSRCLIATEMLSFLAFDLEKRVKALRDGLEARHDVG